ncbi:uncharacterized protein V6R79_025838 [Siganus canaliculatus]
MCESIHSGARLFVLRCDPISVPLQTLGLSDEAASFWSRVQIHGVLSLPSTEAFQPERAASLCVTSLTAVACCALRAANACRTCVDNPDFTRKEMAAISEMSELMRLTPVVTFAITNVAFL